MLQNNIFEAMSKDECAEEIVRLRSDCAELRKMLAIAYSPHLYTDDGEFSCGAEYPAIDFKRMTIPEIKHCMTVRAENKLNALTPAELIKLLNRHEPE